MSVTITAEEKSVYDHIVELEKLGGSKAYLEAVGAAPLLLRNSGLAGSGQPLGFDLSTPVTNLTVSSSWGTLKWSAKTQDGHSGSGSGLGYISTDINISSGDLYFLTWGLMLVADSFTMGGVDGYIFIYFSANSIPCGFLKAKADFGAVAGQGSCTWKAT